MKGTFAKTGFTLIEVVVVVVIIGILAAGVTPMFAGSLRNLQRDRVQRDLMTIIRHAGELAVIKGRESRLYILPEKSLCVLRVSPTTNTNLPNEQEKTVQNETEYKLPESLRFAKPQALSDDKGQTFYVRFFPNGGCDFATVVVTDNLNRNIRIEIIGSSNNVKVHTS